MPRFLYQHLKGASLFWPDMQSQNKLKKCFLDLFPTASYIYSVKIWSKHGPAVKVSGPKRDAYCNQALRL